MDEYWFFTLSAIPQALAALIAMTATFILFKLSRINDSIDVHCSHLEIILRALYKESVIPKSKKPESFNKLFGSEIKSDDMAWIENSKESLLAAYRQIVRDPSFHELSPKEMKHWMHNMIREDFTRKLSIRGEILNYLWVSLILICFTIIFCLVLMPFVAYFSESVRIEIIVLSLIMASASIISTFVSIFKIVRMPY